MGARHVGNAPSDITRRGFLTLSVGAVTCLGLGAFAGAGETSEKTVVIYSCGEGIRNETQMTALVNGPRTLHLSSLSAKTIVFVFSISPGLPPPF